MESWPIVSVAHLNHYYGERTLRRQVLFDVSFEMDAGSVVVLTGPSGSGKSTLLTLIGALRSVQQGRVAVLGEQLDGAREGVLGRIRKGIGYVFQTHNLLRSLSAVQNVRLGLQLHGLGASEQRARSADMLQRVGLGAHIHSLPRQLSTGEKQRVAVGRALVHQPRLILADEPTASLDGKSGREIVDLMHQLAKQAGCAVLMVTHDHRILDIADRVLSLEDGRITGG